MAYSISPISSRNSSLHNSKFPPASSLYQLAGKSNFQLWLSAIKPYLFSNIESTGLILGGWTETKPSPSDARPKPSTTDEENPSISSNEQGDRERWKAANTETCRFIRGTLAMNVIPHVRQHRTAKALWHNLLWLYGEEAGIDMQGGPPLPASHSLSTDGNNNATARNWPGGNTGSRTKLLAALAATNGTSAIEFDLEVESDANVVVAPTASSSSSSSSSVSILPPVTKVFGSSASSSKKTYGAFLEVPSFEGAEEQEQEARVDDEAIIDIDIDIASAIAVLNKPLIPGAATVKDSAAHARTKTCKGKETSFVLDEVPLQISLAGPPSPNALVNAKDKGNVTSLPTAHEGEDEEVVHPGRRVDLSDSSVLIRNHRQHQHQHHRRSASILHLPHPSRKRPSEVSSKHHHCRHYSPIVHPFISASPSNTHFKELYNFH